MLIEYQWLVIYIYIYYHEANFCMNGDDDDDDHHDDDDDKRITIFNHVRII